MHHVQLLDQNYLNGCREIHLFNPTGPQRVNTTVGDWVHRLPDQSDYVNACETIICRSQDMWTMGTQRNTKIDCILLFQKFYQTASIIV